MLNLNNKICFRFEASFCPANPAFKRYAGDFGYMVDTVTPPAASYLNAFANCGQITGSRGLTFYQGLEKLVDFVGYLKVYPEYLELVFIRRSNLEL